MRKAIAMAWRCLRPSCINFRMFAEITLRLRPLRNGIAYSLRRDPAYFVPRSQVSCSWTSTISSSIRLVSFSKMVK